MRTVIMLTTISILTACGGGPGEIILGTDGIAQVDTCDAQSQRGMVGQELTDRAAMSVVAPKVRFIDPGDTVTQDRQEDRLNFDLDENGVVKRVYCG